MSDESLFREVDEAVRQDALKATWDKYGWLFMGGAVAIVGGVAGYKGWNYWREQQAAEAGAKFLNALNLETEGKASEAQSALQSLAGGGPAGYRILANLQLAAALAKNGDKAKAISAYDTVAGDGAVDPLLQGFARIQAATLKVDDAGFDEIKSRLEPVLGESSPWRHSARELAGLSAYREGKKSEAQEYFTQIISTPDAPQGLKQRAEMMLALIVKADANASSK